MSEGTGMTPGSQGKAFWARRLKRKASQSRGTNRRKRVMDRVWRQGRGGGRWVGK